MLCETIVIIIWTKILSIECINVVKPSSALLLPRLSHIPRRTTCKKRLSTCDRYSCRYRWRKNWSKERIVLDCVYFDRMHDTRENLNTILVNIPRSLTPRAYEFLSSPCHLCILFYKFIIHVSVHRNENKNLYVAAHLQWKYIYIHVTCFLLKILRFSSPYSHFDAVSLLESLLGKLWM